MNVIAKAKSQGGANITSEADAEPNAKAAANVDAGSSAARFVPAYKPYQKAAQMTK
jgi:hypothetical protein